LTSMMELFEEDKRPDPLRVDDLRDAGVKPHSGCA
jgi:hypothetical protein